MNDFGRDCLQKQSAEIQKQRFRTTLSRNTSLETAKVTISDETVKKTKQKEGRRGSKSKGFGRDCQQKHEITQKVETHVGTTVSAKSYIFEHEAHTK